jgi:homopolymeric O-antigen transport system ATP-binding protein
MSAIIEADGLSKCYRLQGNGGREFWALRDVSFQVERGDVVGLIGRNGAGKSTLLKLLSRITEPTSGCARLRGRVASLLEVGTGFHPDLSGRENIFLNGAILGMKRSEIAEKLDEIVSFSEIGAFIDHPVKHYSSGMYVRLAFAVAAHLEPEILVIDEVLAVGDAEFQRKCLGKMQEVSRGHGRTVLFVSHNMAAVQSLCTKGILLVGGKVSCQGDTSTVLQRYMQHGGDDAGTWTRPSNLSPTELYFESIDVALEGLGPAQKLVVQMRLRSTNKHRPAFVAVDILDSFGTAIMQALPNPEGFIDGDAGEHAVNIEIDLPPLIPGHYPLTFWVGPHHTRTFDSLERVLAFDIAVSPTPGRSFPHAPDHGHIVPGSRVSYTRT